MRRKAFISVVVASILGAGGARALDAQDGEGKGDSEPTPSQSASARGTSLAAMTKGEIESAPALKHVAEYGARLFELGASHGLRGVVARKGGEFMIFQVAPDGAAVVSGLQADLSIDALLSIAADGQSQSIELGVMHGMRGVFVRNGEQFQVFYATPDGEKVIPGVMWDAEGKNVTREQVAPIPGVTPKITIGKDIGESLPTMKGVAVEKSGLQASEGANFGVIGERSAARVYVFVDPLCAYSVRALQQLYPLATKGLVQAAIIPLSILDYETQGRSTPSALAMLSKPQDQMIEAWSRGDLSGPSAAGAEEKLRRNMEVANLIGVRGTPTVIWRKADGSEGRVDGLPQDWNSVLASLQGVDRATK